MSTYNTVMSAISNMTENELKDLAEILDMCEKRGLKYIHLVQKCFLQGKRSKKH